MEELEEPLKIDTVSRVWIEKDDTCPATADDRPAPVAWQFEALTDKSKRNASNWSK